MDSTDALLWGVVVVGVIGRLWMGYRTRGSIHELSTNMARTSFTSVGSEADSPELLLRPSPATGHADEILDV